MDDNSFVNNFERDIPRDDFGHNAWKGREYHSVPLGYTGVRNRQYQVETLQDLAKNNYQLLSDIIGDHQTNQVPRMVELEAYYQARNPHVLEMERRNKSGNGKADNRATHPFGSFIADFMTSYSVGKPIKTEFDNKHAELNRFIDKINKNNHVDELNHKLYLDASKFGRSYEQVYFTGEEVKFARLDPMNTFVIYDTKLDPEPLMAVTYNIYPDYGNADYAGRVKVDIYTKTRHVIMTMDQMGSQLQSELVEDNKLGEIPIIEYQNNDDRFGDFEQVIPLIDLYDYAQSDTANYMQDFNDTVLLLYGDLEGSSLDDKTTKAMMDQNILALQSGKDAMGNQTTADAKYLQKSMDSVSAEVYKARIQNDIHKFSHIPDFEDKDFSSNSSGVAMKYRLYGTMQYSAIKRRYFEKGLRHRYELMTKFLEKSHELPTGWDLELMEVNFIDNLPINDEGLVEKFIQMGQTVSLETALNYVQPAMGFDTDDELERIKKERAEAMDPYNGDIPTVDDGDEDNIHEGLSPMTDEEYLLRYGYPRSQASKGETDDNERGNK